MTTFRPATPDDVPALDRLMQVAFDPRYGEAWTGPQLLGTLALAGTRAELAVNAADIAGFSLVRRSPVDAELLLVGVDPDRRRLGIGRELVLRAIAAARADGLADLYLEVRACNTAAVALYRGLGFTVVGVRPRYYKGPGNQAFDADTMRLSLHRTDSAE
jgi:ribosomal-protein-alanine N-acetyltransferase